MALCAICALKGKTVTIVNGFWYVSFNFLCFNSKTNAFCVKVREKEE